MRRHLEELVAAGDLDLYIDGGVKANQALVDPRGPDDLEASP